MGLMDKVKAQATVLAQRAEDTARDMQARRQADAMLRDLGAAAYAERTGRSTDQTEAKIDKLVSALSAHETQYGVDLTAPRPAPAPPSGGSGYSASTDSTTTQV